MCDKSSPCGKKYCDKCTKKKKCLEYTGCIIYDGDDLECVHDEEFTAPTGSKLNLMLSMLWAKICSIVGSITTINTTITTINETIEEIQDTSYTFIQYNSVETYPIGTSESPIIGLSFLIVVDGIYRIQYSGDLEMKMNIDYTISIKKNSSLASPFSLSEPKTNLAIEDDTRYISNRISIFASNVSCVVGDVISVQVVNNVGSSTIKNNQLEIVKIG